MVISKLKPKLKTAAAPRDPVRERLLEVARELFAQRGVDEVTVRDLAEAAAANVAAVNYHFGSKDGLLMVLFRREARVVVERRMLALQAAQALSKSPLPQRLEAFVRALIEPPLRWVLTEEVRTLYVPTLLRAATRARSELGCIMERESLDLQPFAEALGQLLPALPRDEVYWRLHFLLGLEHSLISDLPRLQQLSGGLCDTTDIDAVIARTVAFAVQGLAPPAKAAAARAATRAASPPARSAKHKKLA